MAIKKRVENNLVIENARLTYRNFAGRAGKYNDEGDRSFGVAIEDPDLAERLAADGWNVHISKPKDPDEEPTYYISVAVSYRNRAPMITMLTNRQRKTLTEETVSCLDYAEIENVDLVIRPYNWEAKGDTGVKAYLKSMYVTIEEDELAAKYALDDEVL